MEQLLTYEGDRETDNIGHNKPIISGEHGDMYPLRGPQSYFLTLQKCTLDISKSYEK